jgi:hypothetical protein
MSESGVTYGSSADTSTKGASHMSCYVEPRAPTALTEPEVDTPKSHPYIVKLRQLPDSLSQALWSEDAKAIGTEMYEMYEINLQS